MADAHFSEDRSLVLTPISVLCLSEPFSKRLGVRGGFLMGDRSRGTTIGFSTHFVAAGRGKDLTATARVRRRGREISTGEVSVCDTEGKEVAFALVTYKLSTADGRTGRSASGQNFDRVTQRHLARVHHLQVDPA